MSLSKLASSRLDALWLICLALYIIGGAASVPFHGDESTLMVMGRDYHYMFIEGDLDSVLYDASWEASPHEQRLRLLNGTVSKTVYGWIEAQLGIGPRDLNRNWNWGRDFAFNAGRGAIPDDQLLRQARLASALQLALAAAVFFQFSKMMINRPTAYLASALFALHPNVLINGRRAMMEGSHILGLMLVLLAAAWLLRERRWWRYVLLGVCAGFAIAAKHPNLIICVLVFLAVARRPLRQLLQTGKTDWRPPARELAGVAVAGAFTVFTFLLLNPAWWSAPWEVAPLIVELRADLLQGQIDWLGGYESFSQQVRGFFDFVFVGERQYFEVPAWAGYEFITAQIKAYEQSWLAGLLFIGSSGILGVLCLLLSLYGALKLGRDRAISLEARWLILTWSVGSALATLWLTPLPWARYYLPLLPAMILLASYSLISLAQALRRDPNTEADDVAVLD